MGPGGWGGTLKSWQGQETDWLPREGWGVLACLNPGGFPLTPRILSPGTPIRCPHNLPNTQNGPSLLAASHPCSVDSEGGRLHLGEDSEVFKMLQENREGRAAPRQSSSFRLLQEVLEAEERGEALRGSGRGRRFPRKPRDPEWTCY